MPRRARTGALCAGLVLGFAGCGGATPQLTALRTPEAYLPPIAAAAAPARATPADDARGAGARAADAPPAPDAAPAAGAPGAGGGAAAPGAPSDAEVAAELDRAYRGTTGRGAADTATVAADGLATVPITAPAKVRAMIVAGNQVARKPYVYGGGHGGGPEGLFTDSAYDCSGSVSYALASAGFLDAPQASGPLMSFGRAGRGRWVSIYANAGHAFMVVAGLRFDTVGRAEHDTRWQAAGRGVGGFTVRHPPGL